MARGSSKPCPGCKQVKEGRAGDDVCHDCSDLLAFGKIYKELRAKETHLVPVRLSEHPGQLEGLYRGGEERRFFKELYHQLVFEIGRAAGPGEWCDATALAPRSHYGRDAFCLLPEPVAKLLAELYAAAETMLDNAYKAGEAYGTQMLVRMAQGELSINEMNRVSIGKVRNKPEPEPEDEED